MGDQDDDRDFPGFVQGHAPGSGMRRTSSRLPTSTGSDGLCHPTERASSVFRPGFQGIRTAGGDMWIPWVKDNRFVLKAGG